MKSFPGFKVSGSFRLTQYKRFVPPKRNRVLNPATEKTVNRKERTPKRDYIKIVQFWEEVSSREKIKIHRLSSMKREKKRGEGVNSRHWGYLCGTRSWTKEKN